MQEALSMLSSAMQLFSGLIEVWRAVGFFSQKSVDTLLSRDALLSTDISQMVGVR